MYHHQKSTSENIKTNHMEQTMKGYLFRLLNHEELSL